MMGDQNPATEAEARKLGADFLHKHLVQGSGLYPCGQNARSRDASGYALTVNTWLTCAGMFDVDLRIDVRSVIKSLAR